MLPLGEFNSEWMPTEAQHQEPVYVERVSLRDALQKGKPETLLGDVELVEPTFQVRACVRASVSVLGGLTVCWEG